MALTVESPDDRACSIGHANELGRILKCYPEYRFYVLHNIRARLLIDTTYITFKPLYQHLYNSSSAVTIERIEHR